MDRLSFKLAAILGFQLILALILWSMGPDYNAFQAKEPLLAFDPAKVDRVEIAEGSAASVALMKQDGKWTLPSFAGFPADGAKVSGLLTKLAGIKKGWPVATSAEAAKRFKVSDTGFERRIVLKNGSSMVGELLLGASPNFKSVSARAGGDAHVYSVAFPAYEAGGRGDEWLDRSLLNAQQDQVASIAIGDALLERKDGKFVLSGLAAGQKQDETATYRLVGALTYPAFDSVVGKGAESLARVNGPDIEATIKRSSGDPVVLKYKKEAAGGAYLFTSSANDFLFRASDTVMEPIAKAKRETLIEAPKKAGAEPVDGAAGQPGRAAEGAAAAAPEPMNAEEPEKAQDKGAQAVAEPAKPGEPAKAEDAPARAAAEPAKPGEAKKAESEGAQAVPPAEAKQAEDERFQAAMQPPKLDEPKKAEGEGAQPVTAAEPKKAEEEPAAAPQAAKPAERQDAGADGAASKAEPEKPAASQ